ncbi:MAG: glycosyltransferase family 1 protein [Symploca sp. SIO1C2]|nr:glycosyltransferase family 1 protein [Symploca sp. SIO1C2]
MNSTSKKHIALISVHGDPAIEIGKEEAGGQNVYVRQVGEALAAQGWYVDMFTRKANAQHSQIVEHSPRCRTIRLTAGPETFIPRQDIFGYCNEFLEELLKFQAQAGWQYSLVHTNYWLSAWVGMAWQKRQSIKQVHTYHSLGAVKYKSVATIPMIAGTRLGVERAVLEKASRIVATSPQEKDHMRSLISSKGNIDIIPCGTNLHRFSSIDQYEARQQLGFGTEDKVILYVGRFDQRKGIETLVRAVSQSKLRGNTNLKLIIAGGYRAGQSDGVEKDRIERLVGELGIEDITSFPGSLTGDILPAYYAAADVCVVPSYYEPFGLVAIEAMASGTPVVASKVGGLQYTVLPEETGLLVPPKNEFALAAAIDSILSNPELRNKLGFRARARVENKFSWQRVAYRLNNLYTDLLPESAKVLEQASA